MEISWVDSRQAFADAAEWFVGMVDVVGDRWAAPGLGEWDVRSLVGHTSRSLLTVEAYLARPAPAVEVASLADYFRTTAATAGAPTWRRADARPVSPSAPTQTPRRHRSLPACSPWWMPATAASS